VHFAQGTTDGYGYEFNKVVMTLEKISLTQRGWHSYFKEHIQHGHECLFFTPVTYRQISIRSIKVCIC
jgi:hypothetical protein